MSKFEKIAKKEAQIAKLQAEVAALRIEAENEVDPSKVVPGATVDFIYGRAENKKTLAGGVVVATKEQEKGGALVRIRHGEGFDETVYTVFVAAVTKVYGDEPAAEQAAE